MNELLVALIGFSGAIFGSLTSGLIEVYITRKTLQNAKDEFDANFREIREQERKESVEKAEQFFHNESNKFYDMLVEEMLVYDKLRNELHYLNNLTHPNRRKGMSAKIYPRIDNKVSQIVGDVQLPSNIAALLGALRSNISYYNAALDKHLSSEVMEELLNNIYKVLSPINDEMFTNYANAQTVARKYDIKRGKQELE